MDNLTLITCSYNTPDITINMLKSWMYIHNRTQQLILVEGSTNNETKLLLEKNNIPYINNPGGTHGQNINIALENCKTKYALLVDSDVIFLKCHNSIFSQFKEAKLAILGKIEGDRGGKKIYNRVNPWHCFLDVETIKNNNITFFNETKMKESFKTEKIYDIGSTFFEDIKNAKLKIGDIDLLGKYYFHFEGMSWYKNKYDASKEDTGIDFGGTHNNINYIQAYEYKFQLFKTAEKQYQNTSILNKYINRRPILLIKFPTRGRPEKFFKVLDEYYQKLSGNNNVQFLITCDNDDLTMNNSNVITKLKQYKNLTVIFGDNKTKIEAINANLNDVVFDILLLASDDMLPVADNYDSIIIENMLNHFSDFDGVLWFNDGVQQNRLNTLCILGRTYYNRFGYIYNPEYKSLWCDAEFTQVSNMLGKQKYFEQCIIKHEHHSLTGVGYDEIYDKNEKFERTDKNTFLKRQANNFL